MNQQAEMIGVLEAADAEEFEASHGRAYRPGTSFGYFHAPVEAFNQGLSNQALALFFRMLSDESLGQETPEAFFDDPHAVGELMSRRMIDSDGDDWLIFEPEEWGEVGE